MADLTNRYVVFEVNPHGEVSVANTFAAVQTVTTGAKLHLQIDKQVTGDIEVYLRQFSERYRALASGNTAEINRNPDWFI